MAVESRVFGPPGSGKTTTLVDSYIPKAVERFGEEKIMITSFTKAAALEIRNRANLHPFYYLPEEQVGTLHQICFHALGRPKIIEEDKNLIALWNDRHPHWQIIFSGKSVIDEGVVETQDSEGAKYISATNILRNRLVDTKRWHPQLKRFMEAWKNFKREVDAVDYTDLIENALREFPYAPKQPKILFIDEAQDCTMLQLKLARSWAVMMKNIVLVGDDDQTLYHFMGSTPDAFLHPKIEDERKKILEQSYRVPEEILKRAMTIIRQVSVRQPKKYMPRIDDATGKAAKGMVSEIPYNWREPDPIVDLIKEHLGNREETMILASCSYMLKPIRNLLMDHGLPFHNPYRARTRADWNPLGSRSKGNSAKDVLISFLNFGNDEPYWDIQQLVTWSQYMRVGKDSLIKKRGNAGIKRLKEALENNETNLHTSRNVLAQIFEPTAVEQALRRNTEWFFSNLQPTRQKTMEYPLRVFNSAGKDINKLMDKPSIVIGTIHSVKGAEQENVILFPDISMKGFREMQQQPGMDAMLRTFYVGMTRAKERLYLAAPATKYTGSAPRLFMPL